jgi:flagellar basal-body rod modification protein FlgD
MEVNSVSSATSASQTFASNTASAAGKTSTSLDSNQFMQILMAQLTHQNPLEPMDSNEMMNQFSQLNSLQELRDIHTAMDKVSVSNQTTYLASLIGKTIKANRSDGKILEGVVDGVLADKDNPQIRIGTELVDLADVIEIKGE